MIPMKQKIIAVIGDAQLSPDSEKYILGKILGKQLIDEGYLIVTGGLGGIMEAVSFGAHESERYSCGSVIGLLPGFDPSSANKYVDTPIATGMDLARNTIVANSDAVIAIGGGAGTLAELATAWSLFRLVIGYRVEGWSGKLADTAIDSRCRYPDVIDDRVYGVTSAEEALDILREKLNLYHRRHTQIC